MKAQRLSNKPTMRFSSTSAVAFIFSFTAVVLLFTASNVWAVEFNARTNFAAPAIYLSNVGAELTRRWPTNRTVNIVCHGHSVPAGYGRGEVRSLDAYPHLLRAGLSERFPQAVINVIVTAIGGEQSEKGAARFEAEILPLRPDVVTIDYALNDRSIGLERAEKAWRKMIETCIAKNIPVILFTPTADTKANLDDPNDPLNQHAEQIRQLAAEYRVGLVDSLAQFKQFEAAGGDLKTVMAQNNHPNRKGHELVAPELLKWFPRPQ
jgi:acyl-CoA thioesterase-1